jgi:hypothetical protein
MGYVILSILAIIGVFVLGLTGVYNYSDAEIQPDFLCNPNANNGHVVCSPSPNVGDHGLFILDSKNSCPIDVTFIIENLMIVEIQDSPNCKFKNGFTLVLTIDR